MKSSRLTTHDFVSIFENISVLISENAEMLCELDSAIGDGDHGTTIKRGVLAATAAIETLPSESLEQLLTGYSFAMMSSMGGASGPIFSSFFRGMASGFRGESEVDSRQIVNALQLGLDHVVKVGKAVEGDKTLVDALAPGVRAAQSSLDQGESLARIFECAYLAAQEGVENTSTMTAKKGRARYAGERSLGHEDAGATSITLMLQAFSGYMKSGVDHA